MKTIAITFLTDTTEKKLREHLDAMRTLGLEFDPANDPFHHVAHVLLRALESPEGHIIASNIRDMGDHAQVNEPFHPTPMFGINLDQVNHRRAEKLRAIAASVDPAEKT